MRRIRTGRASRLGRRIRCVFCVIFAFTVWRIVGRGENPVGPGTPVSGGGDVRTRSLYLNCHGRAGRIQNDEIKKKKKKKVCHLTYRGGSRVK